MTDRIMVYLPKPQFIELQANIADAMLHAQMIDPDYYYYEDENGDERLTEEGQAEFEQHYDHAAFLLNDGGIWALE